MQDNCLFVILYVCVSIPVCWLIRLISLQKFNSKKIISKKLINKSTHLCSFYTHTKRNILIINCNPWLFSWIILLQMESYKSVQYNQLFSLETGGIYHFLKERVIRPIIRYVFIINAILMLALLIAVSVKTQGIQIHH